MATKKRCPNGTKKSTKKATAGQCVPVAEKKRCPNGYRRSKKSGNCEKHGSPKPKHSPPKHSLKYSPKSPKSPHLEHSTRPKYSAHSLTKRNSTRRRSDTLTPRPVHPTREEYEDAIIEDMEKDEDNMDDLYGYVERMSKSEIKEEVGRILRYNREHPQKPIDKNEAYEELKNKSKGNRKWASPRKRGWLW